MGFHGDAVAASVRVSGRVQRLVNIANEVNEERQIAVATPLIAIAVFETFRVLIDLRGHTVSTGTPRRHIFPLVLQTDVDEVPGRG